MFGKPKKEELIAETTSVDAQDKKSGSLRGFRETLKDVLEDITSLEVNTIIVSNISTDKFDARNFYEDIIDSLSYKIKDVAEGILENKRIELSKKVEILRSKGAAITPKERSDYDSELSDYESLKQRFDNYQKYTLSISSDRFEQEQKFYKDVYEQFSKLDFTKKTKDGRFEPDAATTRFLRKLWETEQTIIHCDRIYAQTRFQLDGDLSNRFVYELFGIKEGDPKLAPEKRGSSPRLSADMAKLILEIHNKALENAESQWSKLINTAVDLVTKLMPYRK